MTKRVVTIPTVSLTQDVPGCRPRRSAICCSAILSSRPTLRSTTPLRRCGRRASTELVLDLRYNGGGLVDVAVHLGSLIGGTVTQGRVFAEFRHNDRSAALNETLRFRQPAQALTLSRLFVITTRSSASASELVINSLRPHLPVIVIGDATYGKPVGQYSFEFCDQGARAGVVRARQRRGPGRLFRRHCPPTCAAADDIEHDLGSGDEASLAEAFQFMRTGVCSVPRLRHGHCECATPPRARPAGRPS